MLSFFLSLLTGVIPGIVKEIAAAKVAMANAATDQDKIAAEERVKALEARRDVLIANSKTPWDTVGRLTLMGPVALLLWKILVWDIALDWGTTSLPSSSPVWYVVWAVLGYYFMTDLKGLFKVR